MPSNLQQLSNGPVRCLRPPALTAGPNRGGARRQRPRIWAQFWKALRAVCAHLPRRRHCCSFARPCLASPHKCDLGKGLFVCPLNDANNLHAQHLRLASHRTWVEQKGNNCVRKASTETCASRDMRCHVRSRAEILDVDKSTRCAGTMSSSLLSCRL